VFADSGGALPFISVVIPTHNRGESLRTTVKSVLQSSYRRDLLEVVIVDNLSTDHTSKVIAEMSELDDRVIGIREERQGAHFARNTGALRSRGEILYFTDDDMIADRDMLSNMVTGFVPGARVASVTGRVLPRWETEPPRWILEHCRNSMLSLLELGDGLIVSDRDPGVFSCHQAVVRDAFIRAGGFNPDTNAREFTGDNETGLNIKIAQLGYRFAYVGSAVTHHSIPGSRMTQQYLNSRMWDQGGCDSYTTYRQRRPGRLRLAAGMPSHAIGAAVSLGKAAIRKVAGSSGWHVDLSRAWYHSSRARSDARLIARSDWREFVLRSDWLTDVS
jgi:glycosyltransferase involved in cell wall biosynthesis